MRSTDRKYQLSNPALSLTAYNNRRSNIYTHTHATYVTQCVGGRAMCYVSGCSECWAKPCSSLRWVLKQACCSLPKLRSARTTSSLHWILQLATERVQLNEMAPSLKSISYVSQVKGRELPTKASETGRNTKRVLITGRSADCDEIELWLHAVWHLVVVSDDDTIFLWRWCRFLIMTKDMTLCPADLLIDLSVTFKEQTLNSQNSLKHSRFKRTRDAIISLLFLNKYFFCGNPEVYCH
jgi:hypothetical protein